MPVFLSKPLYLAECVNVKFHCYHCYKEENYDKDTEIRHGLYFASLTQRWMAQLQNIKGLYLIGSKIRP